jgi:hypothetical protein
MLVILQLNGDREETFQGMVDSAAISQVEPHNDLESTEGANLDQASPGETLR